MRRYVARANIDHYLGLLDAKGLSPQNRNTITALLIAEEDGLGNDLEQLDFAETRAADGRARVRRVRGLREAFAVGTMEREQADRLLANCENVQTLLENFCHQLRDRISARGL